MSDLSAWMLLGVRHILDLRGLDHVLFVAALAAIYRAADWRAVAWVLTSFTVGHSITLALAVTGLLVLPASLVEFLIPVTIVATCVENILHARRPQGRHGVWKRPVLAGVFGLVHGAGFANYLRALFVDDVALPLLGFNIGIEIGQLVALALIGLLMLLLDRLFALRPFAGTAGVTGTARAWGAVQRRAVAVSVSIGAVASYWAVGRLPW